MSTQVTQMDREMFDAIWGKARYTGNSHQRRKTRRMLMRRVIAGRKVTEYQIDHFFEETPFQKRMRERSLEAESDQERDRR